MKKTFAFIVIAIAVHLCVPELNAQDSNKKYDIRNSLQISVMPLSSFDSNPRYRAGLEFIMKSKRAVSIDIGYGSSDINRENIDNNSVGNNYSLLEIRPEFKKYLNINNYVGFYFGPELFYINMKNKLKNDEFFDYDEDKTYSFDFANVEMKKYGFHIKGGFKATIANIITFDIYGGIGYRVRNTEYTNIVNKAEDDYSGIFSSLSNGYKNQGVSGNLSLALGARIGIVLWSSK
ncbi:MAG: hypothetical protein N4A72_03000 [Bacteroidales bacterium]|jgi:hypothetical protein|nr:hypothetical protein [Bacteroidales bacterium]